MLLKLTQPDVRYCEPLSVVLNDQNAPLCYLNRANDDVTVTPVGWFQARKGRLIMCISLSVYI